MNRLVHRVDLSGYRRTAKEIDDEKDAGKQNAVRFTHRPIRVFMPVPATRLVAAAVSVGQFVVPGEVERKTRVPSLGGWGGPLRDRSGLGARVG